MSTDNARRPRTANQIALDSVPSTGGVSVSDPGDGTITKREAQKMMLDALAVAMKEWHARGFVEGLLRERERIGCILTDRAALGRRELAMEIAIRSDSSLEEAVVMLNDSPRKIE